MFCVVPSSGSDLRGTRHPQGLVLRGRECSPRNSQTLGLPLGNGVISGGLEFREVLKSEISWWHFI